MDMVMAATVHAIEVAEMHLVEALEEGNMELAAWVAPQIQDLKLQLLILKEQNNHE